MGERVPGVGEMLRGRRARAWIAVGLWTALILTLAGDEFSAESTEGWLRDLLLRIVPGLEHGTLVAWNAAVRRFAHVFEYAVLGMLTYRALRIGAVHGPARSVALALAFGLGVAAADETRQARLGSRTGSPRDVALDLAGTGAGVALLAWLRRGEREEPADA